MKETITLNNMYVGQKPTRACVVLLFKMPTINKTYLILSYLTLNLSLGKRWLLGLYYFEELKINSFS